MSCAIHYDYVITEAFLSLNMIYTVHVDLYIFLVSYIITFVQTIFRSQSTSLNCSRMRVLHTNFWKSRYLGPPPPQSSRQIDTYGDTDPILPHT